MPVYEVSKNGKVYEVDAPDPQSAAKALERMGGESSAAPPAEGDQLVENVKNIAGTVGNVALGAAKGVGQTAVNLGRLVHQVPGVSRAVDALYGQPGLSVQSFTAADRALEPANTAERVGKVGEQVAEVALPGRAIAGAATKATAAIAPKLAPAIGARAATALPKIATEVAAGAGMAAAQGGDPLTGGAISAIGPILGQAVSAIPAEQKEKALKLVVQALGPTKERFKAMAERRAAEVLKRGLGGSREQLQTQAAEMVEQFGDRIDQALAQFGGDVVQTKPIVDALEQSKQAFQVTNRAGQVVVIEPRAVRQLGQLQRLVGQLGPDATVEQLVAVRRGWDTVVAQAGGYAHRAPGGIGVPLKDVSEAYAKREGANAIRRLLATEVPDLAVLNKEFAFWKDLDDVLTQTLKRTQPQGPGLGRMAAEGAGQVAGAVMGSTAGPMTAAGGALAFGKLTKMAQQVFTSPRWRFVEAKLRDQLADAMMSGSQGQLTSVLSRISAVEASKVGSAAASR